MSSRISARQRLAIGLTVGAIAAGGLAVTAQANPDTASKAEQNAASKAPSGLNGPYLYTGWGNPPEVTSFMKETGTKQLTMAFINDSGGCKPAWDGGGEGERPLTGGQDEKAIKAVQGAGGDVTPSFGGWGSESGKEKLGQTCKTPEALAGAYEKVIDAFKLKSIDIDIEQTEIEDTAARKRVIDALKLVKKKNKGIKVYVTFGSTPEKPNAGGADMIKKAAAAKLNVDGWTIMPFDFDSKVPNMADATVSAVDALKDIVAKEYGVSKKRAYSKVGFSSMNGKTDKEYETVSVGDFKKMVGYAKKHKLARVSFWAINRDDSECASGSGSGKAQSDCSGIKQEKFAFSKILAGYHG